MVSATCQMAPKAFDQQPLEAAAAISACFAAYRVDGDVKWVADANAPSLGFSAPMTSPCRLVDVATGACRDGLHVDRANENRGGESVVSYLLGLAEMRLFARTSAKLRSKLANVRAQPIELAQRSRGRIEAHSVAGAAGASPPPEPRAGGRASVQARHRAARSQSHRSKAR